MESRAKGDGGGGMKYLDTLVGVCLLIACIGLGAVAGVRLQVAVDKMNEPESCCDMVNCEYVAPFQEWVIYACERKLPGE